MLLMETLREALDEVVRGCKNVECIRALQHFVNGVKDYKHQCGQGVVVDAPRYQRFDGAGAQTVAEPHSFPSGAGLDSRQPEATNSSRGK